MKKKIFMYTTDAVALAAGGLCLVSGLAGVSLVCGMVATAVTIVCNE